MTSRYKLDTDTPSSLWRFPLVSIAFDSRKSYLSHLLPLCLIISLSPPHVSNGVYKYFGGFSSNTPLVRRNKRVDCGTISRYTCRRPVLKLKITTLRPYVSVLV